MTPKLPRGTLDKLWNDPANWRTGSVYNCPADPRLIVPKRNKWAGWTLNFAHRRGSLLFMLGGGLVIAAIFYSLSSGDGMPILVAFGVLIITCLLARWLSSPGRFEERN